MPRLAEVGGLQAADRLGELLDQPVMIFHVSTREGAAVIREARGRGVKVFAETCPQYLFLTAAGSRQARRRRREMDVQPAARRAADQEALWRALELGDLQTDLVRPRALPLR